MLTTIRQASTHRHSPLGIHYREPRTDAPKYPFHTAANMPTNEKQTANNYDNPSDLPCHNCRICRHPGTMCPYSIRKERVLVNPLRRWEEAHYGDNNRNRDLNRTSSSDRSSNTECLRCGRHGHGYRQDKCLFEVKQERRLHSRARGHEEFVGGDQEGCPTCARALREPIW